MIADMPTYQFRSQQYETKRERKIQTSIVLWEPRDRQDGGTRRHDSILEGNANYW